MEMIQNINFYKFKRKIFGDKNLNFLDRLKGFFIKVGVVEILVNDKYETIKNKLNDFCIEDTSENRDNWQVLYMEQFFSVDRTIKLCKTYEYPSDDTKNFNLVFFIHFLKKGQILQTPFGKITVTELKELPKEYKNSLDFEKVD